MTKSILFQLSIIMTSLFEIGSPPRIRGGIKQVSRGTTAGPQRDKRWDLERTGERIRGGLRKMVRGVERAGEKKNWTVLYLQILNTVFLVTQLVYKKYMHTCSRNHILEHFLLLYRQSQQTHS